MWTQNILGHKNWNPGLSDQNQATNDPTYMYAHQNFKIHFITL